MNDFSRAATVFGILVLAPASGAQTDTPSSAARAAEASNAFALDLYGALRKRGGNLFFSPYSVAVAMAMVRVGAAGDTAAEMDRVLHLEGLSGSAHRVLAQALRPRRVKDWSGDERKEVRTYEMRTANRLFGDRRLTFEANFLARLQADFAAPLERVDFGHPATVRQRINAWVARQTHNRIRGIVPPGLPPKDALLAVANAIHFRARWMKTFSQRRTSQETFTTAMAEKVQVPMMRHVDSFRHAEVDDAQVLELPYRAGDTAMIVVLPRDLDGLPALERQLDAATLRRWCDALRHARVDVRLPRFSCENAFDLGGALQSMGMRQAFTPTADFSGMVRDERLMLGPVLHKAFVAVDENGTEASAATVAILKRAAAVHAEPISFRADRPFLFVIRHRATGCILFCGRVEDPRS